MAAGALLRAGPRQRQVLALLARGKKDVAIAVELGLSVATVRTYLTRLYRDNGFSNRTEAVAVWIGQDHDLIADDIRRMPLSHNRNAKGSVSVTLRNPSVKRTHA